MAKKDGGKKSGAGPAGAKKGKNKAAASRAGADDHNAWRDAASWAADLIQRPASRNILAAGLLSAAAALVYSLPGLGNSEQDGDEGEPGQRDDAPPERPITSAAPASALAAIATGKAARKAGRPRGTATSPLLSGTVPLAAEVEASPVSPRRGGKASGAASSGKLLADGGTRRRKPAQASALLAPTADPATASAPPAPPFMGASDIFTADTPDDVSAGGAASGAGTGAKRGRGRPKGGGGARNVLGGANGATAVPEPEAATPEAVAD